MADEGEVDVLGDFEIKLEVESEIYDANELPSKSANLLPEYTNPPWMLEQGWNLDMDEKSKATIEKMLLEEQQYLSGKSSKPRRSLQQSKGRVLSSPGKSENNVIPTARRLWSDQEKQMLLKGMIKYGKEFRCLNTKGKQGKEIYGRSWTKIAELIPSRTSLQIKSFANQYLKAKKEKLTSETSGIPPALQQSDNPLLDTLSKVSSAQPTVTVRNIVIPSKGRIPKTTNKDTHKPNILKSNSKFTKRKQPSKMLESTNMAPSISQILKNGHTSINSQVLNSDRPVINVKTEVLNSSLPAIDVKTDTSNHKVTITSNPTQNLDGFCSLSSTIANNNNNDLSEDDDIDIENDDDDSQINPVLQSRSTSPNSVYEKLVSEAKMNRKKSALKKVCDVDSESDNTDNLDSSLESNSCEFEKLSKKNREHVAIEKERSIIDKTDSYEVPVDAHLLQKSKSNKVEKDIQEQQKEPDNSVIRKEPPKKVPKVELPKFHFQVPKSERVLNPGEISDEERAVHPDFFENRTSKTPERYLRIRNYIIESWKKSRPNYLNKTSVRPGLKNCGDVNCIGRIHAYLECIGAINFGCEQASYNVLKNQTEAPRKEKMVKEPTDELSVAKLEAMRPRKRKVRDALGYWIDEKELEGKTIEHSEPSDGNGLKPQKSKQIRSGYDPFKLVPCQPFTEDSPAPFQVEIHKSALIVMDIHAHISKTEVIGMLGGKYCREWGKLTVSMATPCNSISTGMQCEMDPGFDIPCKLSPMECRKSGSSVFPYEKKLCFLNSLAKVSQTQASEEIRSAGLKVIGWYHSHPVFDPNPSVRDMETQLKFQEWFAKGGANFVGIIVSPYNPRNLCLGSEFNCLTVQELNDPDLQCNIPVPYKFDFTTSDCNMSDINNLILTAQDLATSYSSYQNRVDLTSLYRRSAGITCLDKMLESVKLLSGGTDYENQELMDSIRKAFITTDTPDLVDKDVTDYSEEFICVKEEP